MPRNTKADVARLLTTVNAVGVRLGMRGAGSWTVRTIGGTYLYLTQSDGQKIEDLGPGWHSAFIALLNFSRTLHTVELLQKENAAFMEARMREAIASAFEAEAEAWTLSSDSGDRLASIAARAARRATRG